MSLFSRPRASAIMIAMADAIKPRWFRPTPGRLLVVLLAVEGFLWLCERFQWFAFGRHKGYAMALAVASVAVFLLLMLLWFVLALLFRWRFQFSIRSLLVLMVAVALPCGWLSAEMKKAQQQREVVAMIEKLGGSVFYDRQSDADGRYPPASFAEDLFLDVVAVDGKPGFDDAMLDQLPRLPHLQSLLLDGNKVGDATLKRCAGLKHLQGLFTRNTAVTDAGLEHLQGFARLRLLCLFGSKVGDAGLEHLKGLTQLQVLFSTAPWSVTPGWNTLKD